MHVPTAVIPSSEAMPGPPVPLVPRCPHTALTKPECHCPACLLEQIARHGAPAARAPVAPEPAPAGVML